MSICKKSLAPFVSALLLFTSISTTHVAGQSTASNPPTLDADAYQQIASKNDSLRIMQLNVLRLYPSFLNDKRNLDFFIGLNNCQNPQIGDLLKNEFEYPKLATFYKENAGKILAGAPTKLLFTEPVTIGQYDTSRSAFPFKSGSEDTFPYQHGISINNLGVTWMFRPADPWHCSARTAPPDIGNFFTISVAPVKLDGIPMTEEAARDYVQAHPSRRQAVIVLEVEISNNPPSVTTSGGRNGKSVVTLSGQVTKITVMDDYPVGEILATLDPSGNPIQGPAPSQAAVPQTSSSGNAVSNIADISISGVKLGMTVDEAMAALQNAGSWPILEKRYVDPHDIAVENDGLRQLRTYGLLGKTENCKTNGGAPVPRPPLLASIIASRGKREIPKIPGRIDASRLPSMQSRAANSPDCDWTGSPNSAGPTDDGIEVIVYLSPAPGSEHVIAVSMWQFFRKPPSVESVLDSIKNKTTFSPTSSSEDAHASYLSWRFNERGQLMSSLQVNRAAHKPPTLQIFKSTVVTMGNPVQVGSAIALPDFVTASEGVGIDARVQFLENQGIHKETAQLFQITLYRGSDLYAFADQAHASGGDIQPFRAR